MSALELRRFAFDPDCTLWKDCSCKKQGAVMLPTIETVAQAHAIRLTFDMQRHGATQTAACDGLHLAPIPSPDQ